jgi:DNA-binding response OmpR family regulator
MSVAMSQTEIGESRTKKARPILIVEDEANVRLVFTTALESEEVKLSIAEDGEAALQMVKRSRFDLVLLDLKMPGLSGLEFLRQLREMGNDVPVVIITAYGSVPDAVMAMKLGALDFLAKPITPEALRTTVANVLARHAPTKKAAQEKLPVDPAADNLREAKRELNLREFDKADQLLTKALAANPRSAEAHYLRGVLCELRDERHAAYGAYRAALQADPKFEPARLHLMKYFNDRLM